MYTPRVILTCYRCCSRRRGDGGACRVFWIVIRTGKLVSRAQRQPERQAARIARWAAACVALFAPRSILILQISSPRTQSRPVFFTGHRPFRWALSGFERVRWSAARQLRASGAGAVSSREVRGRWSRGRRYRFVLIVVVSRTETGVAAFASSETVTPFFQGEVSRSSGGVLRFVIYGRRRSLLFPRLAAIPVAVRGTAAGTVSRGWWLLLGLRGVPRSVTRRSRCWRFFRLIVVGIISSVVTARKQWADVTASHSLALGLPWRYRLLFALLRWVRFLLRTGVGDFADRLGGGGRGGGTLCAYKAALNTLSASSCAVCRHWWCSVVACGQ